MAKLNISIGGKIEGSLTKSLRELNQSMTQLVSMNRQVADSLSRLSTTTKGNRQTITAAAGSYREAQQRLTAMGRAIREAENGFNSNDPAVRKNIAAYRALSAELKAFDREMGLNYRNVGNYSSATGGLVSSLKQLALSYLSLQTAIQAFSYAFQKSMQLDAMRTSFGFIVDDSIDRIDKLRKEADRLGVGFLTLTETNKKFIAAAKASNFSLEEAEKIFNAVANAGAKLKLSNEQISGTFLAIEQMISKGTVSMEELRRQLGDRLPGAFALAAQAMGMTEAAFNKAVASGEIMAKDLLPKLATELNRVYENNPAEKIDSLQAAFNRWKNVLTEIVDNSNITEYFKGFIEVATQAVGRMTGVIKEGDYTIDMFKSLSAQFKSNQSALSSLISEYLTAKSEISQTNLQSDKLYEINQKIAKILPESVTKWDAYGNAIEVSIDRVIALTNAQRELMDSLSDRAFEAAEKNVNKYVDAYEKAMSRVEEMTRKGVSEINVTEEAGGFYTGKQVVVSLSESINEAEKAAKQAIPYLLTLQEAGRDLGKAGLGILQKAGLDERGAAMRQHTKETREAAEALKAFAEAEKEIRKARTREDVDAVKEMFPNLSGTKSFENAIKARIKAIDDAERAGRKAAAEADRLAKEAEQRIEAIQKVFSENTHKSTIISSSNPELQKVRNEYQKLFDDIDRIEKNALADKKITEAQKTEIVQAASEKRKQIAQAQAASESDILYRQETSLLEKSLQEQYSLWQKYEDWRKNVSTESANERYENELDAIKGFETRLHSEVAGLMAKALTPIGINEAESKRLEMLSGLLKSYYTKQEDENDKYLQKLLTTYESYEVKRKNLAKNYAKDIANLSGEEAAMRTKAYEEELKSLWDAQVAGADVFKELDIQLDFGSLSSAKKALKSARDFVDDLFRNLNPTNAQEAKAAAELKKGIEKSLSGIDRALDAETYDVVGDLVNEFDSLVRAASDFDGTMKTALKSISNMVGAVGSVAKSLGSVMGDAGKGLMNAGGWASVVGATISVVGGIFEAIDRKREQREREREERLKHAEDYRIKQLNLQTSILQKQAALINEMYGTQKIEAYANVINGINKEQERLLKIQRAASSRALPDEFINTGRSKILQNTGVKSVDEWIERYNKAITSTNAAERQWVGQILPQLQREATKAGVSIKELSFDLTNLSDMDAITIQSMIDAGSFDEATSKFLQTVLDLRAQEIEAIKLLKQELTGTTFESIADGLVDIFTRGDDALADFEKNFDELMRKSLIQSLKRSIMSDALKDWYDEFAEFSKDGLDEAEISRLRNSYTAIGNQIKANAENLEKAAGISLSGDMSIGGIAGQISRAITEDTAVRLEGIWRGMFEMLKLGNEYTKQLLTHIGAITSGSERDYNTMMLSVMNSIDENTLRTANNTDLLVDIDETLLDIRTGIVKIASNTEQQSARNLGI